MIGAECFLLTPASLKAFVFGLFELKSVPLHEEVEAGLKLTGFEI